MTLIIRPVHKQSGFDLSGAFNRENMYQFQSKNNGIDLSAKFNVDIRKDFHVKSYFEKEDSALRKQTALNSLSNRSDLSVEEILESLRMGGEDFLDERNCGEFESNREGTANGVQFKRTVRVKRFHA